MPNINLCRSLENQARFPDKHKTINLPGNMATFLVVFNFKSNQVLNAFHIGAAQIGSIAGSKLILSNS